MQNSQEKDNHDGSTEDSFQVQMALALTEPEHLPGECPSDETLAALADNRLDSDQREKLLDHINRCDDCYQIWLETSMQAQNNDTAKLKPKARPSTRFKFGISLLAAACLILFVSRAFYMDGDPTAKALSMGKVFDTFLSEHPASPKAELDRDFRLPWTVDQGAYGFTGASTLEPRNLSFGAGLWTGRQLLTTDSDSEKMPDFLSSSGYADGKEHAWSQTEYAPYYFLGQWCVLIKRVCILSGEGLSTDFLQLLLEETVVLKKDIEEDDLSNNNAKLAIKCLDYVKPILSESRTKPLRERDYGKISEQIELLITHFGPTAS